MRRIIDFIENTFGMWWIVLYSSKTVQYEIGFGYNPAFTSSIFQVRSYDKFGMWLNVIKPTLKYLKETRSK